MFLIFKGPKPEECKLREFFCKNDNNAGECIDVDKVCDGTEDCKDGSDEDGAKCLSDLKVRLSEGPRGIIEVRYNGIWGTVCNKEFGQNEADVFCKMRGSHKGASDYRKRIGKELNDRTYPIWIQFTKANTCNGDEKSILDCYAYPWKHEIQCDHSEDIYLQCR